MYLIKIRSKKYSYKASSPMFIVLHMAKKSKQTGYKYVDVVKSDNDSKGK